MLWFTVSFVGSQKQSTMLLLQDSYYRPVQQCGSAQLLKVHARIDAWVDSYFFHIDA